MCICEKNKKFETRVPWLSSIYNLKRFSKDLYRQKIVQYTYNNYSTLVVYLLFWKEVRLGDNVCPVNPDVQISQYELWWGVAKNTIEISF